MCRAERSNMNYLILLAIIVAYLGFAPPKYGIQAHNYKKYILICGVLIAVVAAFRSSIAGSGDTFTYVQRYVTLQSYESFDFYYDKKLSKYPLLLSEAGFYYIMWLLGHVFKDGQTIVIVSSVFVTFAVCWFIYRNSVDAALSLTIYVCLGLFTFNMNGMRQAIAMSVCLFAYEYVKKQKFIPFILIVLLAMQFHRTAMCFIPMYFLPKLKNNASSWLFYITGLATCLIFVDQIIAGYYQIGGKDYSGNMAADGGGLFVILLYLGAVVLTLYNPQVLEKPAAKIAMLATLAGFTAYIARFFGVDLLERVSYYYFYFPILLIPEVFQELEFDEYKVVKVVFVTGSLLLFIYRIWNGQFENFTFYFLGKLFY